MPETVAAACSRCGRKFNFAPEAARDTCMICGGPVVLPAGFVKPAAPSASLRPLKVGCPVCARPPELEPSSAGRTVPCWFCQAPLLVPDRDGVARLALPADPPAAASAPPTGTVASESKLLWTILQKLHQAGTLGVGTGEWVARQLQKLDAWERAGAPPRSPFDAKFTAAVLSAAVFKTAPAEEEPMPGGLFLSLKIDEKTGATPGQAALLDSVIGLGLLALQGRGWISTPDPDAEPEKIEIFLDWFLKEGPLGTDLGFEVRTSEGRTLKSEKVLGKEFAAKFPSLFGKGARGLLAFKCAFGAAAPGRLWPYLSREALQAQVAQSTGDAAFAADVAAQVFRLFKS